MKWAKVARFFRFDQPLFNKINLKQVGSLIPSYHGLKCISSLGFTPQSVNCTSDQKFCEVKKEFYFKNQ